MIASNHAMIFPIRLPIVLDTAIEKLRCLFFVVHLGSTYRAWRFSGSIMPQRPRVALTCSMPYLKRQRALNRQFPHDPAMTDVPLVLADGIARRDAAARADAAATDHLRSAARASASRSPGRRARARAFFCARSRCSIRSMPDASCGTASRSSAPPFRATGATSRISGSGPRCSTAASKTICVIRSSCAPIATCVSIARARRVSPRRPAAATIFSTSARANCPAAKRRSPR